MPGKRRWTLTGISTLLGLWLFACPDLGYSQGNIQVGPLRIHPFVELSGEWDDNIALAPRDEQEDFIWIVSPGIFVELPARPFGVRLGYRADILNYTKNDQLNATHHTLDGEARVNFAGGLSLYATDVYKRTTDFVGFPVPDLTQRIPRDENTLKAGAEYTLRERIGLAFDYNYYWVKYKDNPFFDRELDRKDQLLAGTLFFRVLPKTSILGEYDYQWIRYDQRAVAQDRDSNSNKFKVGLKGDLTEKTTLLGKVGWEFKDYKSPARRDWDGLIVELEAIYKYQEASQIRLYGGRANFESLFEGNNFYVGTYGGVEISHQLRPRLILVLTGLVGTNDYPEQTTIGTETKKRFDRFYEAGVALRYQIRPWLAVQASYDHLVRDSNFNDFDYTNNRVRGTISATF